MEINLGHRFTPLSQMIQFSPEFVKKSSRNNDAWMMFANRAGMDNDLATALLLQNPRGKVFRGSWKGASIEWSRQQSVATILLKLRILSINSQHRSRRKLLCNPRCGHFSESLKPRKPSR
jgi:hypothetical protein